MFIVMYATKGQWTIRPGLSSECVEMTRGLDDTERNGQVMMYARPVLSLRISPCFSTMEDPGEGEFS